MMTDVRAIAEPFSSHRFAEAFEKLADDVRWDAAEVDAETCARLAERP